MAWKYIPLPSKRIRWRIAVALFAVSGWGSYHILSLWHTYGQLRAAHFWMPSPDVWYDLREDWRWLFKRNWRDSGNPRAWYLDSANADTLTDLAPVIPAFRRLKVEYLSLSFADELQSVEPLGAVTTLESLNLHWCRKLRDVEGLKNLVALKTLTLRGCESLTSVDGLRTLKNLEALDLRGCSSLSGGAIADLRATLLGAQIIGP